MSISDKTWKITKALLICGIVAPLLWVGNDIFTAMITQGYSYVNQAPSELSAVGAPTRTLWTAIGLLYSPLVIAFGAGVFRSASQNRALRITGILLIVSGAVGFLWLPFPMHPRGAERTFIDTMHVVMAGVTILVMILFIGFGAAARGKWFRLYSILTILAMLGFGTLVGLQAPKIDVGPTPWMGAFERVSAYAPMLWMMVLAVLLLRDHGAGKSELTAK